MIPLLDIVGKGFKTDPSQAGATCVNKVVVMAVAVNVDVLLQPFELVYIITDVPAVNAVTKPELDTVATVVLEDVHAFEVAGVAVPVSCDADPKHAFRLPVIAGSGFTLNVVLTEHPLLLVYVITAIPAASAFARPALLIVATLVFEDVHVFNIAGVGVPFSCELLPIQALNVPLIVGSAFTIKAEEIIHPLLLV